MRSKVSAGFVIGLLAPGATTTQPCVEFDAPVMTAGDLAQHIPAFRRLPAELRFGLAPDPGLRRVIPAGELNRFLATSTGASPSAADVAVERGICFVRRSRTISAVETESALKGVFGNRKVQVEIVELSRRAVAFTGMIRFSMHELPLATDPAMPVTWNGWFVESDGRKRPVWARVRLREKVDRAVAQTDIAAGEALSKENTRMEQRESFPFPGAKPEPYAAMFDKAARGPILAGQLIRPERLKEIPAIRRGDTVTLEAISSQTRVAVEGKAQSTAYRGHKVAITTALSTKVILAIAQDKGRATVTTDVPNREAKGMHGKGTRQ